jgi:8-oxo-dGTP diphosphatase
MLQVGVKVILLNDHGHTLLLKRNPEKYPNIKHLWDLPGGRIQAGINLLENLQREVMEETGMTLRPGSIVFGAQDILLENKHIVRITYIGSANGTPKLSEEHVDFGWFTIEEMIALDGLDSYFSRLLSENNNTLPSLR